MYATTRRVRHAYSKSEPGSTTRRAGRGPPRQLLSRINPDFRRHDLVRPTTGERTRGEKEQQLPFNGASSRDHGSTDNLSRHGKFRYCLLPRPSNENSGNYGRREYVRPPHTFAANSEGEHENPIRKSGYPLFSRRRFFPRKKKYVVSWESRAVRRQADLDPYICRFPHSTLCRTSFRQRRDPTGKTRLSPAYSSGAVFNFTSTCCVRSGTGSKFSDNSTKIHFSCSSRVLRHEPRFAPNFTGFCCVCSGLGPRIKLFHPRPNRVYDLGCLGRPVGFRDRR